jgi:hypothetical protein
MLMSEILTIMWIMVHVAEHSIAFSPGSCQWQMTIDRMGLHLCLCVRVTHGLIVD